MYYPDPVEPVSQLIRSSAEIDRIFDEQFLHTADVPQSLGSIGHPADVFFLLDRGGKRTYVDDGTNLLPPSNASSTR